MPLLGTRGWAHGGTAPQKGPLAPPRGGLSCSGTSDPLTAPHPPAGPRPIICSDDTTSRLSSLASWLRTTAMWPSSAPVDLALWPWGGNWVSQSSLCAQNPRAAVSRETCVEGMNEQRNALSLSGLRLEPNSPQCPGSSCHNIPAPGQSAA